MKNILKTTAVLSLVITSFIYISEISEAITDAISRCLNVIIPSLFIMMVLSDYIIKSQILDWISFIFTPLAKIIGIDKKLVPIIILSNTAGYPIGAKLLSMLVKENALQRKQASVIASYCFSAGPAFTIGAVGLCVYQNKEIGVCIFLSILLANVISAVILNRAFKINRIEIPDRIDSANNNSIIDSIESAARSLFSMSGIIIAFSFIITIVKVMLNAFGLPNDGAPTSLLLSFFDVTYLSSLSKTSQYYLPVVVSLISFGGICVWMQNTRISQKNIDIRTAFFIRLGISILSGVIFKVLFGDYCTDILKTLLHNTRIIVNINNFSSSICLIIMIFLLFYKKRLAFQKKV